MGNTLLKVGIGGLVGIGVGLFVGKCKIDQLETERDNLDLENTCLKAEREIMQRVNDNLRETNKSTRRGERGDVTPLFFLLKPLILHFRDEVVPYE